MSAASPSSSAVDVPLLPRDFALDRAFAETGHGVRPARAGARVLNAGSLDGLESEPCRIVPDGKSSIGVYLIDGCLYAVRNQCPHKGAPLCRGQLGSTYRPVGAGAEPFEEVLCNRVLRCPWHGWEFDVVSGKGLYDAQGRVRTYPVRLNSNREIEIFI